MSQETWKLVTSREIGEAQLQLVLQCAPVMAGLKVSNMLNIGENHFEAVNEIASECGISMYVLRRFNHRMTILLYRREKLQQYMSQYRVMKMLSQAGYSDLRLSSILREFHVRYQKYMEDRCEFPHEMGLILGYPVEDVVGFIENNGENELCTGYWKVYANKDEKLKLFKKFENAEERLIKILSADGNITDVCCTGEKLDCA